jgi:chemotaxis protein methyltransferase CheR
MDRKALQQLAALLLERAGLKIGPDGFHGLELALSERMPALGLTDPEEYLRRLQTRTGERELRLLLPLVTVGKTSFFRDAGQFRALERRIVPELLAQARQEQRKLSIWSAGCATGEEPYSVAMVLAEAGAKPREADIWATDVNAAAIEDAKLGRFPARQLVGVSQDRIRRFFHRMDGGFEVQPSLREYIRFESHNLASPAFAQIRSLDLILCRNVIIYFDLPTIRALMERFLMAMRPGAYLLLGYSESLFRVYEKFEMAEVEGAFVYRRASPSGRRSRTKVHKPAPPAARGAPGHKPKADASSKRARAPHHAPAAMGLVVRPSQLPQERLNAVAQLMDRGQLDAALQAVQALTRDDPGHLAALLTLGNLYSLFGRTADSREAFDRVISLEPLCVEVRIFGGVAAMQAGLLEEARSELKKALFLEPTLALGHYLLALLQERMGEREAAKRSYRNAIAQLRFPQRELAGHYPDLPETAEAIAGVARYALAALEHPA